VFTSPPQTCTHTDMPVCSEGAEKYIHMSVLRCIVTCVHMCHQGWKPKGVGSYGANLSPSHYPASASGVGGAGLA
jgi:hypothetical protein